MKTFIVRTPGQIHRYQPLVSSFSGFTLTELIAALAITGVVVTGAGGLLVSVLSSKNAADAATRQRQDLNRVLEVIAAEVSAAKQINVGSSAFTPTTAATAVTDSAASTVLGRGTLNPAVGSVDTYVLYLEVPMPNAPTVCPTGTALAGTAPPSFDRVLYDVRTTTSTWLGPNIITRYGRPTQLDGSPNPCALPKASEVISDTIASSGSTPTCNAGWQLSGTDGFFSCVSPDGRSVELSMTSSFTDNSGKTYPLQTFTRSAFRRGS